MKYGVRKPSIKKSISARTTGRAKRTVKRAVMPGYGKKGMGWVNNPKGAAYNKVYNKTTFSVRQLPNGKKYYTDGRNIISESEYKQIDKTNTNGGCGCLGCLGFIVMLIFSLPCILPILGILWMMFIISPMLSILLLVTVAFIIFIICVFTI